ncbi:hypothetical protein NDU88_009256 [Pleurodeles waltl]|uniref:Uncharacterized protein n=1 Tax=Pleurodeles waltl TaxID=8319 RepID=A0AAV7QT21_PLEWA|nr:hypothetical protein NDU88_009256 [Pleurodeles waltl]
MGRAYVSLDFWQSDNGEGPPGCDTSHASSGHGVQASHQQLGRLAGEQSLPVKIRAPSEHRPEGRVKPRAVYPTSQETTGVGPLGPQIDSDDARPSTSQGAGVGWRRMEQDLLDYEDDVEDPVMSRQRVMMAGDVPGVVQGSHSRVHRRDMVAGNLPRGEEGLVVSVGANELCEMMGGSIRKGALNFKVGLNEQRMNKVDASIQVSSVKDTDVHVKSCEELSVLEFSRRATGSVERSHHAEDARESAQALALVGTETKPLRGEG